MIIGIDIDDTITNHCETWFNIYNENYRTDNDKIILLSDAYKWDFYNEYPSDTRDHLFLALNSQDKYYEQLKILDNVKKTINGLLTAGNQVILISATGKEYQDRKKEWILHELPMLTEDNIIFTQQKNLINVDVMIDDKLEDASKFNCPYILFRRPWNIGREQSLYTDNMLICSNWYEIEKYLFSQDLIAISTVDKETVFSDATIKLIEGIKNAKDNQECVDILNPYIAKWQKQGILIGIAQMSNFLSKLSEDVDRDIKENN